MSKRPYIIYRPPPGWGFWSNFFCVLQGINEADQRQLVPVVDMERYPTRYNEEKPVYGISNAWEYYFYQPSELSLANALAQDPLDNGGQIDGPFTQYYHHIAPPPAILARGRELIRRYIRLKPGIVANLDALIPVDAGQKYLGIHVRGTDQRTMLTTNHPHPNTTATYLEQAVLLDREFCYDRIFLATDEKETVMQFEQQFGLRLLTIPAHRTSNQVDISSSMIDYNWLFKGERQHHRYLLGLEVLIDALLLSRCGHLACGASNVSQAAMYFATDDQVVHSVPPLWYCPAHHGSSLALAYLKDDVPPLARTPSFAVVQGQMKEMQRLVEFAENSRAEAHSEIQRLTQWLANERTIRIETEAWAERAEALLAIERPLRIETEAWAERAEALLAIERQHVADLESELNRRGNGLFRKILG